MDARKDRIREQVRSEAEAKEYMSRLKQENKEALQSALRHADGAEQTGAATMAQLGTQREQLVQMDNKLLEIDDSLTRSDRIIKGMKSIGGAMKNWFKPVLVPQAQREEHKRDEALARHQNENTVPVNEGHGTQAQHRSVPQTADPFAAEDAEELEAMDHLHGKLRNLHMMGLQMNSELDLQKDLLETVDSRMDETGHKMKNTNVKMRKLL